MKNTLLLLVTTLFLNTLNAQEHKTYHDNGQLKEVGQYNNNGNETGNWKYYHENGQLYGIGEFKNGEQVGLWKTYYENGAIEEIGSFDTEGYEKGQWKYYHDNGLLHEIGHFVDGDQSGLWKTYDDEGTLIESETYTENIKNPLQESELIGHWKVSKLEIVHEEYVGGLLSQAEKEEAQKQLLIVAGAFKEATFILKTDHRFILDIDNSLFEASDINMKWVYDKENSLIEIKDAAKKDDSWSVIDIIVVKQDGKIIFNLTESLLPFILEVNK